MKKLALTAAVACALASGDALAQDTDPRIRELEERLEQLEQQVRPQDGGIAGKEGEPGVLEEPGLEIGGLVEVEAVYAESYDGESESDLVLATVELGLGAQISESVGAEVVLLYEDNGESPLDVDTASFTIASDHGALTAGQIYVPFGVFQTNLVSDPLTLELGETRETSLQVDFNPGVALSGYVFKGTNHKDFGDDDDIDNFGLSAGYGAGEDENGFSASLGYINDIGDSDGLQGALASNDVADHVPGLALAARYTSDWMVVIAEYIDALDSFEAGELDFAGSGAEPSAWNLEVGFPLSLAGRGLLLAIAVQGTDEALAMELPERRVAAALSVGIHEGVLFALEWAHDSDYDAADGGTGGSADVVTAQLAVEF